MEKGMRKVEMLKRVQWFALAGLIVTVAAIAFKMVGGVEGSIVGAFFGYLAAVTGNYGLFASANAKEHAATK